VRSGESSHWPFRVRSRCCGTTTKGSPFTTWRDSQAALAGLLSAEFHWRGCTLQEEDASWVTKCLVSGRQDAQVVGLHDSERSSRSVLLALEKKVRDTDHIFQLEKVNRQEVWEQCTTEGEAMEALAASRLRLLQQRKLRLDALKLAKGWEDEVAFMSLPLTTQYGSSPSSPSASPCRRSRNDAPSVFPVPNTQPLEDDHSPSPSSFPSRRSFCEDMFAKRRASSSNGGGGGGATSGIRPQDLRLGRTPAVLMVTAPSSHRVTGGAGSGLSGSRSGLPSATRDSHVAHLETMQFTARKTRAPTPSGSVRAIRGAMNQQAPTHHRPMHDEGSSSFAFLTEQQQHDASMSRSPSPIGEGAMPRMGSEGLVDSPSPIPWRYDGDASTMAEDYHHSPQQHQQGMQQHQQQQPTTTPTYARQPWREWHEGGNDSLRETEEILVPTDGLSFTPLRPAPHREEAHRCQEGEVPMIPMLTDVQWSQYCLRQGGAAPAGTSPEAAASTAG
jgi:hypothetical protein